MIEETLFKKIKEWITKNRCTFTETDSITINVKETWGRGDNKTGIDLNIHQTDSGKYTCVGYISYLSKYEYTTVDVVEVFKTANSEEKMIKVLSSVILSANDLTDTIDRIEMELKDA